MEKIRINNDVEFYFNVYRNGEPESFEGATNISTKIVNESYNKTIAHTYSIVDNIVQFNIDALELKQCGKCRVFISYTKVGDYTVDSPAFELVQYTEDTGGTEVIGIEIVKINISGDIGINRDGASAYEVWEAYHGNEGKTIEQYFEWLHENPTKVDTSRTITAGDGLTGGGDLTEDRTINVVNTDDSIVVSANGIKVDTQDTLTSDSASKPLSAKQGKSLQDNKAEKTRNIVAGAGLTGGGDLSADMTINVATADDSLIVAADNIKVNTNNTLTSTSTTQPLSANQGKVLNEKVAQVETDLNTVSIKSNRSYVELNGGEYIYENFKIGGYNTYGSVVNPNIGTDINVKSFVVNCYKGDRFKLKGVGGYSVALWCFTDLNYNKLTVATGGASANDLEIMAKQNGYLFINFNSYLSVPHYFKYIGRNVSKNTDALMMDVYGSQILWTEYVVGQRYATNVGVGNVVNLITATDTAKCAIIPCNIDDEFIVSGKGAETARLWCFVDSNYVCRSVASSGLILNSEVIKSNTDGYLIVNLQNQYVGVSSVIVIKKSIKDQINDESIAIENCGDYSIIQPIDIPSNLSTPNNRGQVNKLHTYQEFLSIYYDKYITNPDQKDIQDGYSVTRNFIGKDSSGQYDMYEYDFKPRNYNKIVLLSAGMNAMETGGIYGLALFMRDVIERSTDESFLYIYENVRIKVIPIICPWAFDQPMLKYANYNNVNINRNFDYNGSWDALTDSESLNPNSVWAYKGVSPDSEAETKALKKWINANGKSSSLWLDCHQDIGGSRSPVDGANMILAYGQISGFITQEWNKIKTFYADSGKTLIQLIGNSAGSYPKIAYSFEVCGCPSAMIEQYPSLGIQYGSTGVDGGANEGVNCDAACLINYILMIRGAVLGALRKPILLPTKDNMINSLYQVYLDLIGK